MRLELDDVVSAYGATVALRGVSLVVPDGAVVALLGPNGAGKSTLLSVASGLMAPRSGSVSLDGADMTAVPPDQRVHAGLCHITEGRSIYPGLSVADNLRMFAPPDNEADAIERAITAFPRLGDRRRQIAGTMSGGEQQMLALARAYARSPEVVLLDEVSLGLAPIIVDEIFEFLALLKSEGVGLLVVEQYVARALALADYVYILSRGQIVHAAEPGELESDEVFARYLGTEVAS